MSRSIRFVHASDLHLDATFGGVDATDDRVAAALARSTFEALDRVVDLCIEREADFLVIAGDVYNSAERSLRAELGFQKAMQRLAEAGIGAFVVHGNHDPADGWSAGLELPESVVVFSAKKVERHEVCRDGEVVCAVYGRSYPTKKVDENFASGYVRQKGDPFAVAVLHANVDQREGRDNYAPCTIDDLRSAGMDYWALGHIHKPERISDEPRAVYSGCTQGLNPNEEGPRGCFVVEIDTGGAREEFIETAFLRWRRLDVDVSQTVSLEEVQGALMSACTKAREESGGRPIIARIGLCGRSPVHADLAHGAVLEDLLQLVRSEQLEIEPSIWVDRLRDRTQSALDIEALQAEEGLRGDLVRLATEISSDPDTAATTVQQVLAPVIDQLAAPPVLDARPEEIITRARDLCLDLLSGDGT